MYVSKNSFKNIFDLLLAGEAGKRYYFFIEDFNTFMYDHAHHRRRKRFCHYFLQAFSVAEILKSHLNDCFKINEKQTIKLPKR